MNDNGEAEMEEGRNRKGESKRRRDEGKGCQKKRVRELGGGRGVRAIKMSSWECRVIYAPLPPSTPSLSLPPLLPWDDQPLCVICSLILSKYNKR